MWINIVSILFDVMTIVFIFLMIIASLCLGRNTPLDDPRGTQKRCRQIFTLFVSLFLTLLYISKLLPIAICTHNR